MRLVVSAYIKPEENEKGVKIPERGRPARASGRAPVKRVHYRLRGDAPKEVSFVAQKIIVYTQPG